MTEPAPLSVESKGEVTLVTLTRPELLNRFDVAMHHAFQAMLEDLRDDEKTRAVVLASTGKAFSAGGDFEMMRDANSDPKLANELIDGARNLLTTLTEIDVPIVVAMQGPAIGLGATVALACDAIVVSRTAQIADTHVVAGLVAGDGGCLVWPEAVGMLRARRHLLTGDSLSAEEAHAIGLVTDLVDSPDEVLPAAMALAERIAALPPLAVQGTKKALNALTKARLDEVLEHVAGRGAQDARLRGPPRGDRRLQGEAGGPVQGEVTEPRLTGSRCRACGVVTFPAQGSCPACTSQDVAEQLLPRRGTLWTWTVQCFPPKEPYRGSTDFEPFGVGYVELPGALRVEARLTESDPEKLEIGMEMELVTIPVPGREAEGAETFAFRPVPT